MEHQEFRTIKETGNREQRIRISTYQKSCIVEYTVSGRLKFLFSILCSLFFLLCGALYKYVAVYAYNRFPFSMIHLQIRKRNNYKHWWCTLWGKPIRLQESLGSPNEVKAAHRILFSYEIVNRSDLEWLRLTRKLAIFAPHRKIARRFSKESLFIVSAFSQSCFFWLKNPRKTINRKFIQQ